jgi:hypothetical protein
VKSAERLATEIQSLRERLQPFDPQPWPPLSDAFMLVIAG